MYQFINQLINLFWTCVAFGPLVYYWLIQGIDKWFIIGLIVSLIFACLPFHFFLRLHLSRNPAFYKKMGVHFLRKWVQNGDLVKKISTGKRSDKIRNYDSAAKYLSTIKMYTRFHWMCFMFFLISSIHAIYYKHIWMAALLLFLNILYNVTTVLLQQYNWLKINRLIQK